MKKTEKLLIDITFDLLYKRGYCATNLMDILDKAGMTKGAMYYHFKSKHALALASMTHYLEDILNKHWIEPLTDSDKPIETLINQINIYSEMFADKEVFLDIKHGCPLSNFILDMSNKDDEFFEYLKSVYERWQDSIEKALIKAQSLGQIEVDVDVKKQALFIISSIEGCVGSAKAYNDLETLKDGFKIVINYIKSL
jgi:TetR/AcrR family transcriptional regulator, transcriptional repressor for nem operon